MKQLSYKALGVLLEYPDETLLQTLPEIDDVLKSGGLVKTRLRRAVRPLLARLAADPTAAQEYYVSLFDTRKHLSLCLFEHIYGESRERGQAMAALADLYRRYGFNPSLQVLPDYLPLFCEFLAQIKLNEAQAMVKDSAKVLTKLHQRLVERESDYATVFAALLATASIKTKEHSPAVVSTPTQDRDAIDKEWDELPAFSIPSTELPPGFIAAEMERPQEPAPPQEPVTAPIFFQRSSKR